MKMVNEASNTFDMYSKAIKLGNQSPEYIAGIGLTVVTNRKKCEFYMTCPKVASNTRL